MYKLKWARKGREDRCRWETYSVRIIRQEPERGVYWVKSLVSLCGVIQIYNYVPDFKEVV